MTPHQLLILVAAANTAAIIVGLMIEAGSVWICIELSLTALMLMMLLFGSPA